MTGRAGSGPGEAVRTWAASSFSHPLAARSWRYDDRMLRFLTAGESHGPALVATLEGMPAGVPVSGK